MTNVGICRTLRRVLEMNREGFDFRRARRALNELVRRSISADVKSSDEGVLGMMTTKKKYNNIRNIIFETKKTKGFILLTSFSKQIQIPFVCLFSHPFIVFFEFTSYISGDCPYNVKCTSMQHKTLSHARRWIRS